MSGYNPMAGFNTDPWSGNSVSAPAIAGANPWTQFDLGGYLNPAASTASAAKSITDPSFMQGMIGYTNPDGTKVNGWGGAALGLLQGLGSAYMGMQQYGLAKDQLQFSKDSFAKNYGAQKSITNATMEDRQRARVASNPGAYQSVGDYMAQNGIK